MKLITTNRGFRKLEFKDSYNEKCSLQISSSVEPKVWLGIEDPKLTVFENKTKGKYINAVMPENFSVISRMHLTVEQVKQLIPFLQNFVSSGGESIELPF